MEWVQATPVPCQRTQVFRIVGTPGVLEEKFTGVNDPLIDPEDHHWHVSFSGPPDEDGIPTHGAEPTPIASNIVPDFEEPGDNNANADDWIYTSWVWVEPGQEASLREVDATFEAGGIFLGKCSGANHLVSEWTHEEPYSGGVIAEGLQPGFHRVTILIHDEFQQSGVDVEWSLDGGTTWVNIPAGNLFATKPVVTCEPALLCGGALRDTDGFATVALDRLAFVDCDPRAC